MRIARLKTDPVGLTTQQVLVVKVTASGRVRIQAPCLVRIYWRKADLRYGQTLLVHPRRLAAGSLADAVAVGEPSH